MASKIFSLQNVGEVTIYKRRGTTRINLRIISNKVRVTQPYWLPYATGLKFAERHKDWISNQIHQNEAFTLTNGKKIGKSRTLLFSYSDILRSRITDSLVIVYLPAHLAKDDALVKDIAHKAIKRALKKEAEQLLPNRLEQMASKYGFTYTKVTCKSMRTRWGSCNNLQQITLNSFLLMTPWELIDYVLVHELVHTRHLHHGKDFWYEVERIIPDYKERRRQLKIIQRAIAPLQ